MRAVAVLSLFAVACSGGMSPPDSGTPPDDSGTPMDSGMPADSGAPDAGIVDAGPSCSSPQSTSDEPCGGLAYWSLNDGGTRPRNHHMVDLTTVSGGTFLYVIGGGNSGAYYTYVDRFPVNADGTLGASDSVKPLPIGLAGMTGGFVGNLLVVAGGQGPSGANRSGSYFAPVGDDGSLGAWQVGGDTGKLRMHGGAVTHGDAVYVLGGFNDPNVWDDVVKATVQPDGGLSEWADAGTLPGPRSHFAVSSAGDYVYITGGLDMSAFGNPPNLKSVSRGHFNAAGELGEWAAMPDLPVALATHGSFIYGGYLYTGGGINTIPKQERRFWRAPISPADHSLGAWQEVAALPVARGHVHNLPVFNDHVYSVAGAIDFNLDSTGAIYIGNF
jgi:hypothetical protein